MAFSRVYSRMSRDCAMPHVAQGSDPFMGAAMLMMWSVCLVDNRHQDRKGVFHLLHLCYRLNRQEWVIQ